MYIYIYYVYIYIICIYIYICLGGAPDLPRPGVVGAVGDGVADAVGDLESGEKNRRWLRPVNQTLPLLKGNY